MPTRSLRTPRSLAALAALAAAALVIFPSCSGKMDEKDCTKLKIESFDILNKPQHCNTDVDCKGSVWPDCAKPLSQVNSDEIKKKQDPYFTGKCEETKPDCKDTTPIYCKQGLCTRKEKGTPESAGDTPPGDIIVH